MSEQKNSNLVRNASVLMIASIVSRVIGLLYRRPLGEILGSVGLGYYGFASNLYSILLLISSYSIPMATSKIISEKLAQKRYKSAEKIFKASMLYAVVVGGVTALFCWFFGSFLLPATQQNALPALRALAPTIFLSAILGVLRGYFQAHRTMTPTSISQILEQIMNAAVSILAAWLLIRAMAPGGGHNAAVYGAMGGTIGTGAGVLVGLLFMGFVYYVNRNYFRKRVARDKAPDKETYQDIVKMLVIMITPIIFTSFIYNCSAYLDSYLYAAIQGWHGIKDTLVTASYGEYSNYYVPLVGIPLALASASTSAMMPEVSGKYAINRIDEANEQVNQTLRLSMFICIPAMVGLTVLAYPIMGVLFPSASTLAARLLLTGSVFVVTDSFSIITGGVLQAIGKQNTALINAGISLLVNLASLAAMLVALPGLDIYAVMLSNIVFSVVCCVLNIYSMHKYLGTRHEIRKTYVEPLIAAVFMGAIAWIIYYLIFMITRRPFIGLLIAVLAAVLVYLILYVIISKIKEDELRKFPMGSKLVRFLQLIRIFK